MRRRSRRLNNRNLLFWMEAAVSRPSLIGELLAMQIADDAMQAMIMQCKPCNLYMVSRTG